MKNANFVGKIIKNIGSLKNHEIHLCSLNPNKISIKKPSKRRITYGKSPWNKGLTKDTDERVLRMTLKNRERYDDLKKKGIKVSDGVCKDDEKEKERRRKISETMKANPLAGRNENRFWKRKERKI